MTEAPTAENKPPTWMVDLEGLIEEARVERERLARKSLQRLFKRSR